MPYATYRPDLMGRATLDPAGACEAGSWESFTLTYIAGAFGVDDGGSLKIGFRFATDFGPVQLTDPEAPGYTTVEASNGARLEAKWEFRRNIRPWSRSLYIGVVRDFLAPGDTITVRFGDRRFGSPGIRLQTYCESAFEFRVFADPIATYDYVAIVESPRIEIVPGPGVRWSAIVPTLVRVGAPFRLALKIDDQWGNPTDRVEREVRLVADGAVTGLPEMVRLTKGRFGTVVDGLSMPSPGDLTVRVIGAGGEELCRSNPLRAVERGSRLASFWGDTHGQSNETLGTNTAREYFAFGRDKAHLDVIGHQANDFQITRDFWRELNGLTRELDVPGRFVCLPGYEWSANTAVGGDRNVHFRHEGETLHRSSHALLPDAADMADEGGDAHDAHALFDRLRGKDCVVVAHVGGRYADLRYAHDPALETAVEIHSAWGTFEWLLKDAFALGHRVGIVANSDGHKGRPGACFPGASFFGSAGGLTCFLAERLDRDAIFEAMRRRRHYATTGNRAILDVAVELKNPGEVFERDPVLGPSSTEHAARLTMGDIARVADDEVTLAVEVVGSAPIVKLDLFDGLELIETIRPYTAASLGARVRLVLEGAEVRGRARATTWDGRLSIAGNRILRASMINTWNLDRGIQHQSADAVTWTAVTTGNFVAIDLRLVHAREGRIRFETAPMSGEAAIGDLGVAPAVFPAGGLDRAVRLERLPDTLQERRLSVRRRVRLRPSGDTRLYVRAEQEDGHRMWSSPIYLFRG
jgi:hypothetical protein